jgi:hypothetical protein
MMFINDGITMLSIGLIGLLSLTTRSYTMAQTQTITTIMNTTQDDCIDLSLILAFDDRPIDVSINLRTTDGVSSFYYWRDYIPYQNESTTTLQEELCLPKDACYLLQVVDKGKIYGWTTTTNTTTTNETVEKDLTRAYVLSVNRNVIDIYDSRVPDSCFSVHWYQFGYACTKGIDIAENDSTTESTSTVISVHQGSIPCPKSEIEDNDNNNTNQTMNDVSSTNTSTTTPPENTNEISIKGMNVTISFQEPSSNTSVGTPMTPPSSVPSLVPSLFLSSDTPVQVDMSSSSSPSNSVPSDTPIQVDISPSSSSPSLVPTDTPIQVNMSLSSSPSSSVPSNTPIQVDLSPSPPSSVPSNTPVVFETGGNSIPSVVLLSDMPSIHSSIHPSDIPSNMPSIVPTIQCIDFHFIVHTDDHPEEMVLTLVVTNEHGSEDDIVIWDHIQPWKNSTFVQQIVNETTCIYSDECYTFTVEDSAQDGLTKQTFPNSQTENTNNTASISGYFTLMLEDDRIISYYDSKLHGCYRRKVYKFGLSFKCAMTETTDPVDQSCPQVRRQRR